MNDVDMALHDEASTADAEASSSDRGRDHAHGGPALAAPQLPRARAAVRALASSKVREVANAGFGRSDVLRFWFGESDQPTPRFIGRAAAAAIRQGRTFYTHNHGSLELREALQTYLERLHGRSFAEDRLAVSSSGVSALMVVMQALLDPGARVVAVTPVWPNVTEIPHILGAHVIRVPLQVGAAGWALDLERLLAAITPETRLVLINSPNNPTGWNLPAEARAVILAHCRRLGVWLLADDVYERLVFGPDPNAPSFLAIADPEDRLVSTNSFSKAWRMTGWRLGWIVAPAALHEDLGKLIEYNTSCAPDFVQAAGTVALQAGESSVERFRRSLARKRDRLLSGLQALPQVQALSPQGGMYAMLRVGGFTDSVALARRLVDEAGLGLAPGVAFGEEAQGWLRWCFATADESLQEGLGRLASWSRRAG